MASDVLSDGRAFVRVWARELADRKLVEAVGDGIGRELIVFATRRVVEALVFEVRGLEDSQKTAVRTWARGRGALKVTGEAVLRVERTALSPQPPAEPTAPGLHLISEQIVPLTL